MTDTITVLTAIQERIYTDNDAMKTDVYYTEGKGALIVPHDQALIPPNVILTVSERQLRFMAFRSGGMAI
jgi:hypothetical protein